MTRTVHVIPDLDVIEHEESEDCLCGPTTEPVPGAGGRVDWIVTHQLLAASGD